MMVHTALQMRTSITAYFSSKQLLLFVIAYFTIYDA